MSPASSVSSKVSESEIKAGSRRSSRGKGEKSGSIHVEWCFSASSEGRFIFVFHLQDASLVGEEEQRG